MKKLIYTLGILLGAGLFYNAVFGAFAPISSPAIGTGSASGTVLVSNGTTSRWYATSTLGISGSLFTDNGATTYLTSLTDNLGLGTTSVGTGFMLGVQGNILVSGTTTAADLVATRTISIPGSIRFPGGANGNTAILITDGGNIAASDELLLLGSGSASGKIRFDSGASNWDISSYNLLGGLRYENVSGEGFYFVGTQGGDPTIYVGGSSTSTISGNGSRSIIGAGLLVNASSTLSGIVGIGTTTPSQLLSVQGGGLFSGNLSLANLIATGTLNVGQLSTLSGGLLSSGSTTLASLNVTGPIKASSTLSVVGSTTLSNTLSVTGAVTASGTLTVAGNVGIGTSTPGRLLSVQGNVVISGTTTTSGLVATGTIDLAEQSRGGVITSIATGTILSLFSVDYPITITKITGMVQCTSGLCVTGTTFNLRHASSMGAASTTAATLTTNALNINSTTTLQSFSTGFNDNTLAANEMLWLTSSDATSSPTFTTNLLLRIYYFVN